MLNKVFENRHMPMVNPPFLPRMHVTGRSRHRHSLVGGQAWGGEGRGSRLAAGQVVPVPLLAGHAAPEDTAEHRGQGKPASPGQREPTGTDTDPAPSPGRPGGLLSAAAAGGLEEALGTALLSPRGTWAGPCGPGGGLRTVPTSSGMAAHLPLGPGVRDPGAGKEGAWRETAGLALQVPASSPGRMK